VRGRHKKWAAPLIEAHPEIAIPSVDPGDPFFDGPVSLEIGAGKGDFALSYVASFQGKRMLCLERDVSVAGAFLKKALAKEEKNVRLLRADFDDAYESLSSLKFEAIFVNFPDPWPKKKHWKRRLVTRDRLLKMASLLKDGGEIRLKTDNDDLYAFAKEEAGAAKLTVKSAQDDYAFDQADDAMSEYERNFRLLGKPIHRLIIVR
jgi:tRNA (guanine-N7-)-methyltransferase